MPKSKFIIQVKRIPLTLSIMIIVCLGTIVYSDSLHCSFHLDDHSSIIANFAIKNIHHLQNIWDYWPCRFLTYLSLALNYHFSRFDVLGYHLFNLAVHILTAILVSWFTLLTLSTPALKEKKIARHADLISLFAGLIFVAHPLQTEAVTYIVQRAESMAAMFYLASLCFYIKSRTNPSSILYYMLSLATAIMAMFTKETAITLPLMILLYEFVFLKTKKNFNWAYILPFFLIILIIPITESGAVRLQQLRGNPGISPIHYLLTQIRVMMTYIRLVFLPINQNLDYDYPISKSIFELPTLLSFLFLTTALLFAKRLFSKYRLVSFSILWFFLTLLPESSFLPLKDVIFEHRLYLPLAGYSLFLVSSLYYLTQKNNLRTMVKALIVLIACYSVLTYQRNKVWRDEITLWQDIVGKSPHKTRAYENRGAFWALQGDLPLAIADFNQAIAIDPNDAVAYNDRGTIYFSQGNVSQASSDFSKAIEINPDYADAYSNHGNIYYRQGKITQAILDYSKAIEIDPDNVQAYNNRAIAYYRLSQYDKAWGDVHKIEKLGAVVDPRLISELKTTS